MFLCNICLEKTIEAFCEVNAYPHEHGSIAHQSVQHSQSIIRVTREVQFAQAPLSISHGAAVLPPS